MSTVNPFDLLEDVESDDPSLLIEATEKKIAAKKAAAPVAAPAPTSGAKLPTKPLPPAQAVKEARNNTAPARGGRGGAGRGGGRGGRGYGDRDRDRSYRDFSNTNGYTRGPDSAAADNGTVAAGTEEGQSGERGPRGPRGPYRGGGPRRSGYGNGEEGEEGRPRRSYDRHSGTGRGYGMKKDGAGRANWGTTTDENPDKEAEENVNSEEKTVEKELGPEDVPASDEAVKEKEGDATNEAEQEKEEDKEMTLEEYEKVLEEKRRAVLALKAEERKVEVDKELQSMQVLSVKKNNDEVFIKLGADKESKKKESAEEKAKKSLSINEFLKPAEGESFYGRGRGRGGGRGRGDRGSFRGDNMGRNRGPVAAPSIADQNQFPSLGGK